MDLLDLLEAEDGLAATRGERMRADQATWLRYRDGEMSSASLTLWRDEQGVASGEYVLHPERRTSSAYLALCRAQVAYDTDPTCDTRDLLATLIDLRYVRLWAARDYPLDTCPRHAHELMRNRRSTHGLV